MPAERGILCLAYLGRVSECQQAVAEFLGGTGVGFREGLITALDAAVLIADVDHAVPLAAQLADAFSPNLIGNPELSCASVGRVLGGAAALAGQLDQAEDYSRQAIAACERARFRPELALTRLQLAEVLSAKASEPNENQADALTPTPSTGSPNAPMNRGSESAGRTGQALSQREREALRHEALGHLDFAIDEFRAMKMQPALERALRHKGLLHA